MKILIIGSGAREHAIGWKLKQDDPAVKLFFASGNTGTEMLGTNLPIKPLQILELVDWAKTNQLDWTIVGPEGPLCAGVADAFRSENLPIFGPNRHAAQLEGSKIFTKNLLHKYGIPTAQSRSFQDHAAALAYSQSLPLPQVVKADGLAAGKGVIIAQTHEQAAEALKQMMQEAAFGEAGAQVVIEEFLEGVEASMFAVMDGRSYALLPSAMDHKRLGDGDTGPNTGGMGAVAPNPYVTDTVEAQVRERILDPLMLAFAAEQIDYQGVLFIGLMLTAEGPQVIEFNVRFGDPECEAQMPLLKTPLISIVEAVHTRTLDTLQLDFLPAASAGVVLVTEGYGYPAPPRAGDVIEGLGALYDDAVIFHAATAKQKGNIVTTGGRTVVVTAWAPTLAAAQARAYQIAAGVHFEGMQYRQDIGSAALRAVPGDVAMKPS